jgi:predicted DNA-binding protein
VYKPCKPCTPRDWESGRRLKWLYVLHSCQMSNTLTIRLPEELLELLREKARRTGLPIGRLVRQSIEATLTPEKDNRLMEFAGIIKGGPRDVSSRKGFSRK